MASTCSEVSGNSNTMPLALVKKYMERKIVQQIQEV